MSPAVASPRSQCVQCNNPTTKICSRCSRAPDSSLGALLSIHFCSAACQAQGWPSHKNECKARQLRKVLTRAAETLLKAFLVYRENTFEKSIDKVEEKDGALWYHEGTSRGKAIYKPWPKSLVKNEKDRQAILANGSCVDALAGMMYMVEALFTGKTVGGSLQPYFS